MPLAGVSRTVTSVRITSKKISSTLSTLIVGVLLGVAINEPFTSTQGRVIPLSDTISAVAVYDNGLSVLDRFERSTGLADSFTGRDEPTVDFRSSQLAAWAAAASILGIPTSPGLVLRSVYNGSPADQAGFVAGDIVIDLLPPEGTEPDTGSDVPLSVRWREAPAGTTVLLLRDGDLVVKPLPVGAAEGSDIVDVGAVVAPPVPNGPSRTDGMSATLALALWYLDDHLPGSLTGGRSVVATGVVRSTGAVAPIDRIGKIGEKADAVVASSADVFVVPQGQRWETERTGDVEVIEVDTLEHAVLALCGLGSDDGVCSLERVIAATETLGARAQFSEQAASATKSGAVARRADRVADTAAAMTQLADRRRVR